LAQAAASPDSSLTPPPSSLGDGALKIGYLLSGSDLEPVRPLVEKLIQTLKSNQAVMNAMKDLGYSDIWPRQCDSSFDMIQRLGAEEFDLAFATGVIYARQFRPRANAPNEFETVAYQPILQFKNLRGDFAGARDTGVFRQGAIFVGLGSPLWGIAPTDKQIRAAIEMEWMAVPDSNSAAGYIYPRLAILDRFPDITPRGPIFCRSGEEVVKHVASALIHLGACETRLLEGPLGIIQNDNGKTVRVYQELLRTAPIPTDPILLKDDFLPSSGDQKGSLGRELKTAIIDFFNDTIPALAPDLKVHKADPRSFEDMARALRKFDATIQDGKTARP